MAYRWQIGAKKVLKKGGYAEMYNSPFVLFDNNKML